MQFDDRLATVLRHRAAGERAARTQFRQLLDLLGSRRVTDDKSLMAAAWLRLAALGEMIPASERAAMISEPGLRFRNPELAYHLAEDEPEVAAAALAHAKLSEEDWNALIPRLPVRARGFLRLRRGMLPSTVALLERLGIHDRGLPQPDIQVEELPVRDSVADVPPVETEPMVETAIGALVRRIETFRKARAYLPAERNDAPRLPLGEDLGDPENEPLPGFAFTTNIEGRIDWVEHAAAPMVVGARLDGETIRRAMLLRQPIRSGAMELAGPDLIAGSWVIDATPRFAPPAGQFSGYAGMFRRPPAIASAIDGAPQASPEADRIRQLLHELRTPANAIQGFAEVIQQQVFGSTPHEYRALAANIASDGARILAGFDEIDRLARLEAAALELDPGASDINSVISPMVEQLQGILATRTARFEYVCETVGTVPLSRLDCESLAWRILATIAGSVGGGENLRVELSRSGNRAKLACELPAALAGEDDVFSGVGRTGSGALRAGMFGSGFSLRLARAEARAVGGNFARVDDWLIATLPLLTGSHSEPSHVSAA